MYRIYFQKQDRRKLTSESLIDKITEIDPKPLFEVSQHSAHFVYGFLYNVHVTVHGLVRLLPSLGSCSPTNTLKIKTFPALSPEYIFPPSSSKISVLTCPRWSSISCFNCNNEANTMSGWFFIDFPFQICNIWKTNACFGLTDVTGCLKICQWHLSNFIYVLQLVHIFILHMTRKHNNSLP